MSDRRNKRARLQRTQKSGRPNSVVLELKLREELKRVNAQSRQQSTIHELYRYSKVAPLNDTQLLPKPNQHGRHYLVLKTTAALSVSEARWLFPLLPTLKPKKEGCRAIAEA